MINAHTLYRTKDLRSLGIGSEELMAARRSGIVRPRLISRQYWYLGAELIAWSETRTKGQGPPRNTDGPETTPACAARPPESSQVGVFAESDDGGLL